jgi:ADP-ribosylglycohydrolase
MNAIQLRAGIYGVLVGDALGVPYEFRRPGDIGEVMWGARTHRAKPGTWSDDVSLTLALLDSLCSVGFDTDDQARRFLAWADTGAYSTSAMPPRPRSPGYAAACPPRRRVSIRTARATARCA